MLLVYFLSQPRSQGVPTSYADHEAEGTPSYTSIRCAQNLGAFGSHYGFHCFLGNANRLKMTVALEIILQKINRETKNQHSEDLISTFLKVFEQQSGVGKYV